MNFTAIDFETANRKRSSACSIGMAKVRNGEIVDTYYHLLYPFPEEFEFINISTHGITPESVRDAPSLLDSWSQIMGFIDGDVLVGHNVSFEQSVINQYMTQQNQEVPELDYLCTLYMSRVNYPKRLGYKLDDICKDLLGKKVNHHHALEDAMACAELAVHHISKYREQDVRELIKVLYETPIRNKPEWKKLTGIKPSKEELDPNHPYYDKKFVITGILDSMSREQAVLYIVDCGGVYQDKITKSTDFLVMGNQDYQINMYGGKSGKTKKVEEYNAAGCNIKIISEQEFMGTVVP